MRVVNKGTSPAAFRDDAGKHFLKPRQSIEVKGDYHLPMILAVPGIELASTGKRRGVQPSKILLA